MPRLPWFGVLCRARSQGLLSCARSLVTDFPQGVRECREPELGLEELLRHRCQLLQQHEEYQVLLTGVGGGGGGAGPGDPPVFCGRGQPGACLLRLCGLFAHAFVYILFAIHVFL